MPDLPDVPAGEYTAWLHATDSALLARQGVDVPCGSCDACCRAAQFIEIEASETETLRHIPAELLFAAPGKADTWLLGYNSDGHCPMLTSTGCSIYTHRPLTCRSYDCRIFAAAKVTQPEPAKADVARQAARWQFSYRDSHAQQLHRAVMDAADFIRTHAAALFGLGDSEPVAPIQLCLSAIKVHRLFLASAPSAPTLASVTKALAPA